MSRPNMTEKRTNAVKRWDTLRSFVNPERGLRDATCIPVSKMLINVPLQRNAFAEAKNNQGQRRPFQGARSTASDLSILIYADTH